MSTLFERRVEQEWRLLQSLAEANPDVVKIGARHTSESGVSFDFSLLRTQALLETPNRRLFRHSHLVQVHFPRFFPAIPIEARLNEPVFHPNVHPENGFVCLWGRLSSGDTVVQAIAQLQRVITWALVNREPDHLMQPAALEWLDDPTRSQSLPLPCQNVRQPQGFALARTYRTTPENLRRRLS